MQAIVEKMKLTIDIQQRFWHLSQSLELGKSKPRNEGVQLSFFTSSKLSNEKMLDQVKPEKIKKYPFGHGNISDLFEHFATLGLRINSGGEQF